MKFVVGEIVLWSTLDQIPPGVQELEAPISDKTLGVIFYRTGNWDKPVGVDEETTIYNQGKRQMDKLRGKCLV